ncbi:MAG TPA: LysR family transcriptional regulator [Cellvibrionaceae bacterium]|nr:LysR family transcriptional regulator [Cellvibrionaceae bacterium]HMY37741.1 LysR family transcriptional regulator [Marinagarivorans sp.]HNG58182.1 LysR family transcriptional regulator [Cellvibrionaceae bacterium]
MADHLNLNDMYIFYVVANAKSITAAGKILHITKQSLSRRVAQYEESIGVTLISRNTRKLELTQAGAEYLRHCTEVVNQAKIAQSKLQAFQVNAQGSVRIHMPEVFHTPVIAALLAEFSSAHPNLRLDILSCDERSCLIADGIDVQFRLGKLEDCALVARSLGRMDFVQVTSRRAQVDSAEVIPFVYVDGFNYRDFSEPLDLPKSSMQVDNFSLCKKILLSGYGQSLLPLALCHAELKQGDLINANSHHWQGSKSVNLVFLKNKFLPINVRKFIDFMVEKSRSTIPWQQTITAVQDATKQRTLSTKAALAAPVI